MTRIIEAIWDGGRVQTLRAAADLSDDEIITRFGLCGAKAVIAWPESTPDAARVIHPPRSTRS